MSQFARLATGTCGAACKLTFKYISKPIIQSHHGKQLANHSEKSCVAAITIVCDTKTRPLQSKRLRYRRGTRASAAHCTGC